jgi:hypothetical protein
LSDISDGGTAIHIANRLPAACKVYFEFALPGQQQPVRLSGEVAWQDASGRTGIRFLDVPQSSRQLIATWLEQNSSHSATDLSVQLSESTFSATHSSESRFSLTSEPTTSQPSPPKPAKAAPKGAVLVSNAGNRRGDRRVACKVGAEVYRAGTSVPNRCTLSDISEGGCYVEMPSPLAGQAGVEILVRTADMKFKVRGQVLSTHPGFGMGVRFTFRNSTEREEILRLLAVLSAGPTLNEQPR